MTWRFWRPRPTKRPNVRILDGVIKETLLALQSFAGKDGPHEGIVYWAGRASPAEWIITSVIVPEAVTTRGSFRTSAAANARVVALLAQAEIALLAQVHSHPGTLVDHSDGDDTDALMPYENMLSIIVPKYGRTTLWPLEHCGVHRFEGGRFRRLSSAAVNGAFRCIPLVPGEKR